MISFVWDLTGKKSRWSANVTAKENELTVTLLCGKIGRRFRSIDENLLKSEISSFLEIV